MKALEVQNLKKTYSDGAVEALKGISFSVERGDFFALLGPNGAGKSTTINIISNLVVKDSGKVSVFDADLDTEPEKLKSYLGLVPQEFNFNIFEKVGDIVIQQAGYYGMPRAEAKKRAEELLKKLGLWEKRNTPSRNLSGGMKRKLMIVRALVHNPKLLILDEPTAGVDVETRREMWEFMREMNSDGMTIILTTHYLEEAEQLCKKIAIIDKGEIIKNTSMKELITSLDTETYVLDLKAAISGELHFDAFEVTKIDDTTLEATIKQEEDVNSMMAELDQKGVKVDSMRNKANRLEELFIGLTKKQQ